MDSLYSSYAVAVKPSSSWILVYFAVAVVAPLTYKSTAFTFTLALEVIEEPFWTAVLRLSSSYKNRNDVEGDPLTVSLFQSIVYGVFNSYLTGYFV